MQAINIITQGWHMAEVNSDGSRASGPQRAFNFMANGGGTVTFRLVTPLLITICGVLINAAWGDLKDGQNQALAVLQDHSKTLSDQSNKITENHARIDAMQGGQQKIWLKLGDHDGKIYDLNSRVVRLEGCQPNCHPR